jgi:hypothetical protein
MANIYVGSRAAVELYLMRLGDRNFAQYRYLTYTE